MARKPKVDFEVKCENCGYIPEPNKEKSNEHWAVFSTTCPKCGGRVKMTLNN